MEQFTLDYLKKLNRKYRPERIILEYNPLWSVKKLEEMELPRGWGIVQEIVMVDASCFQIYMQNMKSVFMEMAKMPIWSCSTAAVRKIRFHPSAAASK